jgi:hypothetical protein
MVRPSLSVRVCTHTSSRYHQLIVNKDFLLVFCFGSDAESRIFDDPDVQRYLLKISSVDSTDEMLSDFSFG